MPFHYDSSSDNDSDSCDRDPGREVVEKNIRHRLQRIADHTKQELNKVLKRVDNTLNNYDNSVRASLIQHGMTSADMSNVEHVADIKELENLLNDSLAKQRYKQRLMVFIVGQTEQASEKARLLQQIEQFFSEQKQVFSTNEFNTYENVNESQDEVDLTLKSFDVKDCYTHVKELGTRLNELNEDIIHYLIQNAGTKQQAKGKKKLALAARETREQLANLQSKLEMTNTEMINRDNKIETLEKEIETLRQQAKTSESKRYIHETSIQSYQNIISELEDNIEQYKSQINDLTKTLVTDHPAETEDSTDIKTTNVAKTEEKEEKFEETIVPVQIDEQEVPAITIPGTIIQTPPIEKIDRETQTFHQAHQSSLQIPSDNIEDLNVLFNSTDGIDLNNVTNENLPTAFTNLQKIATDRVRELLRELEIKEFLNNVTIQNLQQELDDYKKISEKEKNELIEQTESAYQLQIKAQKAAEEAIVHLKAYMSEQEQLKPDLIHHHTQTDEEESLNSLTPSPEHVNPIEESSDDYPTSHSKIVPEELESIENFRQPSLKEKYVSLIDEKKQELDQLKQQAEMILSRPTSIKERITLQSVENSAVLARQLTSFSSFNSGDNKEYQAETESIIKQDQQQQTSFVNSRPSSTQDQQQKTSFVNSRPSSTQDQQQQTSFISSRPSSTQEEPMIRQMIRSDQFKLPFFHLYETIHQFRLSTINLLEQNKFLSLADCLQMIKQLSSNDQRLTNDILENAERVLKDTIKVFQTCLTTLQSTINEYQLKEKEFLQEPESFLQTSSIENQQALLLEQKESMITDLTTKYEYVTEVLNQVKTKYEEEANQTERTLVDQQKLIQNLQQELFRLQKRLVKIETEGIIEPSIMFTRLDAERNEQTLQRALSKGKVAEITYNELNEVMTDYVELPSKQLSNLVKRYIQFRKAAELENRIQDEVLADDTKNVLEKMELLYERRSNQMSKHMLNIRQQRANLARILTEKFDHLEDESSIFLIRPVYSYQGRAAVQSYWKEQRRRREALLKGNSTKKKHHPSRQSVKPLSENNQQDGNQTMLTPLSALSTSDDEERLFRIEKSLLPPQSSPNGQQNDSNVNNTDWKQKPIQSTGLTRIQELDIQRALLPVSHVTTPLSSAVTNNSIDLRVPSVNLRSYVSLSRPGLGNIRTVKPNEIMIPVARRGLSTLPGKSHLSKPHTPDNSSNGDLRRVGPALPPIKRTLNASVECVVNERQHSVFVPYVTINEVATTE